MGWATDGSEGKRGVEDGKSLKNGNPDKAVGMEEDVLLMSCLMNTEGDEHEAALLPLLGLLTQGVFPNFVCTCEEGMPYGYFN